MARLLHSHPAKRMVQTPAVLVQLKKEEVERALTLALARLNSQAIAGWGLSGLKWNIYKLGRNICPLHLALWMVSWLNAVWT